MYGISHVLRPYGPRARILFGGLQAADLGPADTCFIAKKTLAHDPVNDFPSHTAGRCECLLWGKPTFCKTCTARTPQKISWDRLHVTDVCGAPAYLERRACRDMNSLYKPPPQSRATRGRGWETIWRHVWHDLAIQGEAALISSWQRVGLLSNLAPQSPGSNCDRSNVASRGPA